MIGYSAGTFGGGSDLSPPELGNFQGRSDFDAVAFWTLQNLGVGNVALIREAQSHLRTENYQMIRVLDQVRDEVAEAYARAHARWAQIGVSEQAVRTAQDAYREDLTRIRGQEGLPIEVLDSVRLLGQGRGDYLNAIVDYNRAELELYVALGQPPANVLARPAPGRKRSRRRSPKRPWFRERNRLGLFIGMKGWTPTCSRFVDLVPPPLGQALMARG